jgi:ribose 5-phosphate isomerase B
MRIAVAADHAGVELKKRVKRYLLKAGCELVDFGVAEETSVDYPDYARRVVESILYGETERGVLICGTGIGMSIAANRFPGIRAALCHNLETARLSRSHNDSNVLALGARTVDHDLALEILAEWLKTEFHGGRHSRRLNKLEEHAQSRSGRQPGAETGHARQQTKEQP